ncbi:hypothetical protein [Wolbachia endosymbiont of Chironomus riparius]|jgi:1,4-alpha-glucan branching enzyme|uniref:hypothetical protein n=1 Tax=Wolbachia endosymbiont of Chironomus riparius TaxID=2883238 RepID=UPI0020A1A512|nr:hypothetical protein [Wolbachia endosymbiont of Chironomus riparius]
MSLERIAIYSLALLIIIKVLLFLGEKYENSIQFSKKANVKRHRAGNKWYNKKKHKELEKHKEILRDNQNDDIKQVYKEDIDIVGIEKPLGKWTKMVMQNGGFMLRLAKLIRREGGQKGFWELFVKAQASDKGKYKGKGR